MSRRLYENRASFDDARRIRERFQDREMERVSELGWTWPKRMDEVGTNLAIAYSSNKWQRNRGTFEDYKHVSEGPQRVFLNPEFDIVGYFGESAPPIYAASATMSGMPDAIAELADFLGIQIEFDDAQGKPSGECYQVNIVRAKLGSARHPVTGETFLLVYTRTMLCMLITGSILGVEKDGIVG